MTNQKKIIDSIIIYKMLRMNNSLTTILKKYKFTDKVFAEVLVKELVK